MMIAKEKELQQSYYVENRGQLQFLKGAKSE